ncbi:MULTISPECIES: VOC family protein [unclassified Pseudoalteromonas]|uniref:VOC family protein n=1 Tax=unclassified Pseudoalteromonas TaxID=194690 RepID=UPI000CF724CC|nr:MULTISPECIES: VOC family protein [unclassified Pseudoalteromonas]
MSTTSHEKFNYIEYPARDLRATKDFFTQVFNWQFTDYGPEYSAFSGAGLDGGFYASDQCASTQNGSALMVFYSSALEQTKQKIENAGGVICKPIFSFPGGRRFHFIEPSGNEFAVWSEPEE